MLLRWFRARYPDVVIPEETLKALSTNSSWDTHARITELFLDLARTQHAKGIMDADLQIALGVLFYTNSEYDRAQDCFAAALNVRPKVLLEPLIFIRETILDGLLMTYLGFLVVEQARLLSVKRQQAGRSSWCISRSTKFATNIYTRHLQCRCCL